MSGKLAGWTALVTGASSGLGADFARILAAEGATLVLVARRAEALTQLAEEIRSKHGTGVEVLPADLADPAARAALPARLAAAGLAVDILVNNAGFGVFGNFAGSDWSRVAQMLEVDVVALTHLTHLFLPGMRARRRGRVLLVASTAAFQPTPNYAVYAASKAYVLSFGVALNQELRGSGVNVTTLSPGVTRTEFHLVSGQRNNRFVERTAMSSEAVARIGIRALLAGRTGVVAGVGNAALAASTRLAPRSLAAALAARIMRE